MIFTTLGMTEPSLPERWDGHYRAAPHLVQTFNVNNLKELTNAARSGTLTVAGTTGERRAQYEGDYGVTNVTVSGTGLSSGTADLYLDGSCARTNTTLVDGQNTYTAMAHDANGRSSHDTVTVDLPASSSFAHDGNGDLTNAAPPLHTTPFL